MKRASTRSSARAWLGASALLAAATAPGLAFADMTSCTQILSLPTKITTPGLYCLGSGLSTAATTSAAVSINSDNVVLDCNNYEITSTSGTGGTMGISATGRSDLTVRNCRVIGFNVGIKLVDSHRARLLSNQVTASRNTGISTAGAETEIANNLVFGTTGPNAITVSANADSSAQLRGNIVRQMNGTATTLAGIRVTGGGRVVLRDNVVSEIGVPSTTTSAAIMVNSAATLFPSPAVIVSGGYFKADGTYNYAVQKLGTTSKVVCEGVNVFTYTSPATPGCL